MRFFIPRASDATQTEQVYQATRKFMGDQMGATLSDRRVCRIQGVHNGEEFKAEVGKRFESPGEDVIAILFDTKRNLYYVCTANRGVKRGMPYLVGGDETLLAEDFE